MELTDLLSPGKHAYQCDFFHAELLLSDLRLKLGKGRIREALWIENLRYNYYIESIEICK